MFAVLFFALGLAVLAMSTGYFPPKSVFVIAGLGLAWAVAAEVARARAAQKRREEHPLEPWLWDHPWDSRWATHGSLKPAISMFASFVAWSAVVLIFRVSSTSDLGTRILVFVVGLFPLVMFCRAAYRLLQYLKYGKSRFHFARFPLHLGRPVEGSLEVSQKVSAASSISLTMRYIEEVTETRGSGKNRTSQKVLYCLQEVKREMNPSQFDLEGQGKIPISIELPKGDFPNLLLETPRRYWELEAKAGTLGIDFDARFLLPVYRFYDWLPPRDRTPGA